MSEPFSYERDDLEPFLRDVPPSWKCPHCGRRSYNPNDVAQRYCAYCHHYCDDERVNDEHRANHPA
jgi:hypothetical protein